MTRVLRILAALLVLVAASGAESSCGQRDVGGGVKSDRPAIERKCKKNCKIAEISAEASGPYEVYVVALDLEQSGRDTHGPEPYPPGHKFTGEIKYESGARIEISLLVTAHPSDRVSCTIVDGQNSDRQGASGRVLCKLTTSQ